MDPEISQKLEDIEQKVDAVFSSAEKMRKYFMWTLIISVAVIVLPLIGIMFLLPKVFDFYSSLGTGLF